MELFSFGDFAVHYKRNDIVDGGGAESTQPYYAAGAAVLSESRDLHSGVPSRGLDTSVPLCQCARRYRQVRLPSLIEVYCNLTVVYASLNINVFSAHICVLNIHLGVPPPPLGS